MKPSITALAAILLALSQLTASAMAQEDGFTSLIQTDSLDGWRGDLESWTVKDKTLIGHADGTLRANRFIVADIEPEKNFELRAEVWISAGGNSGLQYRSEERPDLGPFVVTGYQCDVVSNNDKYNGMLYEERGRRILSHTGEKVIIDPQGQPWVVEQMPVQTFAAGEWHQYRVLVEGNHHRHWIDDVPTADLIDLDEQKRSLSGVIGVQVHVGPKMEIRYRNFKLKRLPDNLPIIETKDINIPATAEKVVPQGGWKQAGVFDMNAKLEPANIGSTTNTFRAGGIWLAAQPSMDDIRLLPELGIKTIISLRKPEELDWDEKQLAESLGLTFVQIPFKDAGELTDKAFTDVAAALRASPSGQGTLMHCSSGNRVAAVWLVHRVLQSRMASAQAISEAKQVGLKKPEFEQKAIDYLVRKKKM